jgi:hypothetical protein
MLSKVHGLIVHEGSFDSGLVIFSWTRRSLGSHQSRHKKSSGLYLVLANVVFWGYRVRSKIAALIFNWCCVQSRLVWKDSEMLILQKHLYPQSALLSFWSNLKDCCFSNWLLWKLILLWKNWQLAHLAQITPAYSKD